MFFVFDQSLRVRIWLNLVAATQTLMHHCVYAAGPTYELLERVCYDATRCCNYNRQLQSLSIARLFREMCVCSNAVVPISSPCKSAGFNAHHGDYVFVPVGQF